MAEQWVGLADAVQALRSELSAAMDQAEGQALRFKLGTVEMEFLLEVSKERSADAGVRFWVISLGGKGGVTSGSTHRVKLELTPTDSQGRSPLIADEEADPLSARGSVGGADRSSRADTD